VNNSRVIIKQDSSRQAINEFDTSIFGNLVEPFFDFEQMLLLYYANTYHRRAINIKAKLFASINDTNLDKFLVGETPESFLQAFVKEFEIYGNAFLEQTPLQKLYILPAFEARLNTKREIYQYAFNIFNKIDGFHLKEYSPRSRFYGEPCYLATIEQIKTTQKADIYNSKFLDNGARPGMAIVFENSEPTPEQLQAFKQFFGDNFKGYDNANKTLILSAASQIGEKDAKIRLEKLSEIEDISFKLLKEVNRDEIIAAHGVPPRLVGVVTSGQLGGGNELLSQLHSFNELEIKPKQRLIESFFKSFGVELKLNPLDTKNYKDDTDLITQLVDRQIISIAEAKELLNLKK